MEPAQQKHGVKDNITIQGEGPVRSSGPPPNFMFGRMFPQTQQQPMLLRESACLAIGLRMTAQPETSRQDSDLPAGYTYFGQFIDHDVTADVTEASAEADNPATDVVETTPDAALEQGRSPSLDLDSLYGSLAGARPDLVNGFRFKIGPTTRSPGGGASGKPLRHDLPRGADRKAIIGDGRNDENLAVAQTHLMWLIFHNEVAEALQIAMPGTAEATVLEQARDLVTRHYQHVVLHDYLPRIIDAEVYRDIIINGNRKVLMQGPGEVPFMPLEFSVAAYRLGHSQVREEYEWNINFGTDGAVVPKPANFRELFRFSAVSGDLLGFPTLPSNWITDFRRLYDLSAFDFPHLAGSSTGPLNLAKALDPYIAPALGDLPELQGNPNVPFTNLAALNLRRGSMRALPSGQDISRALPSVKMLTKTQMKSVLDDAFDEEMDRLGFYERTPLWLYIMIEAAVHSGGNRMGPLGSTIVADTFQTLVVTSRTSILAPDAPWDPSQAQALLGAATPLSTIADILAWTDARTPIVDPLQDDRNA